MGCMTDGNRNNKIITMMKEMYNLPPVDLLCKSEDAGVTSLNVEEMEYIKRRITEILKSFGIEINHRPRCHSL